VAQETYESNKVLGRLYRTVAKLTKKTEGDDDVEGHEALPPRTAFDSDALDPDLLTEGYETRL
jgi:hypothetical protein